MQSSRPQARRLRADQNGDVPTAAAHGLRAIRNMPLCPRYLRDCAAGPARRTRAPSVGSLPALHSRSGLLPLSRVRRRRPATCAGGIPRRGRSFCLRVCGCAPSAVQPAFLQRGHTLSRRVRATVRQRKSLVNLSKSMSLRDKRRHGRRRASQAPYSPIARAAVSSSWFSTRCSSTVRPPPCCVAMSVDSWRITSRRRCSAAPCGGG